MKNKKILIISAIILLIIVVLGVWFYSDRTNGLNLGKDNENTDMGQQNNAQNNMLVKEGFSIVLPQGWMEGGAIEGVSALAYKVNEKITDVAAKAVNFVSYFSIASDVSQGRNIAEYAEYTKTALRGVAPEINFVADKDLTIDNRSAHAIEAELTQEGIDFKILLVMIQGEGDKIWITSFNTLKSTWNDYKEDFYQTANTFKVKIN